MKSFLLSALFIALFASIIPSSAQAQATSAFINCDGVEDFINLLDDQCAEIRRRNNQSMCAKETKAFNAAYQALLAAQCFGSNAQSEHCQWLRDRVNQLADAQRACRARADLAQDYQDCLADARDLWNAYTKVCR